LFALSGGTSELTQLAWAGYSGAAGGMVRRGFTGDETTLDTLATDAAMGMIGWGFGRVFMPSTTNSNFMSATPVAAQEPLPPAETSVPMSEPPPEPAFRGLDVGGGKFPGNPYANVTPDDFVSINVRQGAQPTVRGLAQQLPFETGSFPEVRMNFLNYL